MRRATMPTLFLALASIATFFFLHHRYQKPAVESEIEAILAGTTEELANLETARLKTVTVVSVSKPNKLKTWMGTVHVGSLEMAYKAFGSVRAGIDLQEGYSISQVGKTTWVHLPAPKVLSTSIDVRQSQPILIDRRWLAPPAEAELVTEAQEKAVSELEAAACNGLLDQAGDRAEQLMEQLLSQAKMENVQVKVAAPSCSLQARK
ncbi:DUF4230 domain-containing protein [Geitlerinema sp. PCC 9228]|uniref:DUF4230 domain-containing protein n=1 Tax=Geitlerinema sp. PCC 9228 TaxID=111611 RepID=UPI001114A395|nr:DUF4230 domain-containing protein [Geitlerinema sp. PCC 9228]